MVEGLVSVIIPVYNRENTIKRAIDSVLSQTYSNIELTVVDDGSTDQTVKIVSSYRDDRVRLICQREHGGANKARNIGIENSRGEYIAFQDSDDEWLPDKLMIQMNYMRKYAFDACYSSYYYHVGNGMTIIPPDYWNKEKYGKYVREVLREGNSISTQTLIVHKRVLDKLHEKAFDEELPRLQDYDFAIRIAKHISIAYIEEPLVHCYNSKDSISNNIEFLQKAISLLMKKHGDFLDIRSYYAITLDHSVFHADLDTILETLDSEQCNMHAGRLNCRDELITYMLKQIRRQYHLLINQYENVIKHIEDGAFAIYGAGKIGKAIYSQLLGRGVRPSCFLVTEKGKEEYIDHIPIYAIDEYKDRKQMIVVGVGEELQNELVDNLVSRGFLYFCVYQKRK